jgi:hypothetical protein
LGICKSHGFNWQAVSLSLWERAGVRVVKVLKYFNPHPDPLPKALLSGENLTIK